MLLPLVVVVVVVARGSGRRLEPLSWMKTSTLIQMMSARARGRR
jgi:hypothetical protein